MRQTLATGSGELSKTVERFREDILAPRLGKSGGAGVLVSSALDALDVEGQGCGRFDWIITDGICLRPGVGRGFGRTGGAGGSSVSGLSRMRSLKKGI